MTDTDRWDGDRVLRLVGIGLVAFVTFQLALVGYTMVNPPQSEPAPSVEWEVTRLDGNHVRIEHAGGEPVEAAALMVTVNGVERAPEWSGTVGEGDATRVLASEGDQVQVYWLGSHGDRELLLSRTP